MIEKVVNFLGVTMLALGVVVMIIAIIGLIRIMLWGAP